MDHTTFKRLVINRLNCCNEVLTLKDKEYSSSEDRLHNFKQAGKSRNCTPVKALDGMMMKHIISFWDIVDRMENDSSYVPPKELVAEKLGDMINYTLLAEGLIEDRREELETPLEMARD